MKSVLAQNLLSGAAESCALPALPDMAGAYRWFYADVTAGPYSAVCIFMLGSLFSPRYSVAARRGGHPLAYSAVNFALYHQGVRKLWVLSEYPRVELQGPGRLRIGRSTLTHAVDGTVRMDVDDGTAPWGRPVRASLTLRPLTGRGPEVQLMPGLPHYWQPLAPRAEARLEVSTLGVSAEGMGYHDTNHGQELLGARLSGWHWARTHHANHTVVDYHLPDGVAPVRMVAGANGVVCERGPNPEARPTSLTGWGLRVPAKMHTGNEVVGAPRLLESSPFYARLESRRDALDTMGEVADFRRFHSPFIRWMAHFRTRLGRTA
ncbi:MULTISPECIES: carotenoid 1,2-hydratase [unclassified Corallococcus]|uniref:carotenoid 1,2-hydratase n=1 Tax=unclassified Corallococcus TaxID=2685029 RepID=UPI001A8CE1FA|nr:MULTISPECIES: carotenoid 1,2-hydratase [unclassified Corallococcus]MBN9688428.1 carotenoid 1,2-hydratase [Corallococcus sp. NCSPR001]WAS87772.1 carotenoid 1,2-hydratase [Corallococcus sp. NCRR]